MLLFFDAYDRFNREAKGSPEICVLPRNQVQCEREEIGYNDQRRQVLLYRVQFFFVSLLKTDSVKSTAQNKNDDDEEMRKQVFQGEAF